MEKDYEILKLETEKEVERNQLRTHGRTGDLVMSSEAISRSPLSRR